MSSHRRLRFARSLTCIAWQLIATNYRFYVFIPSRSRSAVIYVTMQLQDFMSTPAFKISSSSPFKMIPCSHMIISVQKMAPYSDSQNGAVLNVIVGWNRLTTILSTSFQKYKQRDVRLRAVRAYDVNLAPAIPSLRTRTQSHFD